MRGQKSHSQLLFMPFFLSFRLNRTSKVPTMRHSNHKKWDIRNGHYNSNGILSNYNRNFRKSQQFVSNADIINTDEHFNENCLAKDTYIADVDDKCQDKANGSSLTAHHSMQLNKFNEGRHISQQFILFQILLFLFLSTKSLYYFHDAIESIYSIKIRSTANFYRLISTI